MFLPTGSEVKKILNELIFLFNVLFFSVHKITIIVIDAPYAKPHNIFNYNFKVVISLCPNQKIPPIERNKLSFQMVWKICLDLPRAPINK